MKAPSRKARKQEFTLTRRAGFTNRPLPMTPPTAAKLGHERKGEWALDGPLWQQSSENGLAGPALRFLRRTERMERIMEPEKAPADPPEDPSAVVPDPKAPSRYLMTKRGYLHPQKTYVWITLLIIGVMSVLYFVLGLGPSAGTTVPPIFGFGVSDLYFHSIAIGMAALGVYLVFMAFDLQKYEPSIDFPLCYRALAATVTGAIGGIFYLRPVFNAYLAPFPIAFILIGLILLADVGGALLIELYLLPGKLAGSYDPEQNMLGMIPRWRYLPSWKDFRKMDSTYWLTFVTVISAFLAGLIGFVTFWLNYIVIDVGVSPSIFSGYIDWLGGAMTLVTVTMGSHSHMMVMAIIIGVVAVVAKRFDVLGLSGWKRGVAKTGLWVALTGTVAFTVVLFLEAATTVFPTGPVSLFASDPGGSLQLWSGTAANGMAGDDSTMLWASAGAMIVLVPLLFTQVRGRPAWKDPVRGAILGTWILSMIATPIQGFYIELNGAYLRSGPGPQDIVFGQLQYFALVGITLVCMALLAVDFYVDRNGPRTTIGGLGILSVLITTIGGYIYTFLQWGSGSFGYWFFTLGFLLMDLFLLVAMVAVFLGQAEKIPNGIIAASPEEVGAPVAPPKAGKPAV